MAEKKKEFVKLEEALKAKTLQEFVELVAKVDPKERSDQRNAEHLIMLKMDSFADPH